jgi:hypothetical protein
MAAASAGLLFLNGIGAIGGPLVVGWMMEEIGPAGFFVFLAALLGLMAAYAAWRMTRRPAPSVTETGAFVAIAPTATRVAAGAALGAVHEAQEGTAAEPAAP